MTAKPLVSIVCTTYNHANYVRKTIEGFLIQKTSFPFEIIIHDDCSSDDTQAIIQEYTDLHPEIFKPIFQPENIYSQGRRPMKVILPHCQGKYIAACEGDDYWTDPNKLQTQVDFLESNPDYVISCHNAFIIDEQGNTIEESKLPECHQRDFSGEELILSQAWVLTNTWVYRNVDMGFPKERFNVTNGDTFFLSQIGTYGKSHYHTDIQPAAYRVHTGGVWSTISETARLDSRINTWFWLYKYYSRTQQPKYARYYWDRFMYDIYTKLSSEAGKGLDAFPPEFIALDSSKEVATTETLIRGQIDQIKQLQHQLDSAQKHNNSLEKQLRDLKQSASYRLGDGLLAPLKKLKKSKP